MTTHMRPPMASSDVRDHNLSIVLASLERLGSAARAEIALETGLARSAISNLSSILLTNNLVRVSPHQTQPRVGHPLERLELDGRHIAVVGVQVEVDEVHVLAQDLAGRSVYREVINVLTHPADPPGVAELVADAITKCASTLQVAGTTPTSLDLIVPGLVHRESDLVSYALDLGWIDVPFKALVAQRTQEFPSGIHLAGDAQFAAYAEYNVLRGEAGMGKLTDMLYIKSATGIGGAAMIDGEIFRGSRGTIFAPGHVIVDPNGTQCACGRRGCLVTVADPERVVRNAGLEDVRQIQGLPAALAHLVTRGSSGRAEDRQVSEALDQAFHWIRAVVDNAIHMYEPQVVVLGGYLGAFADRIAQLADVTLDTLGLDGITGRQAIVPARLGEFAALFGALRFRRMNMLNSPSQAGLLGQYNERAETD
jgi:predicted NBD/HSP70 family sugar kinase